MRVAAGPATTSTRAHTLKARHLFTCIAHSFFPLHFLWNNPGHTEAKILLMFCQLYIDMLYFDLSPLHFFSKVLLAPIELRYELHKSVLSRGAHSIIKVGNHSFTF